MKQFIVSWWNGDALVVAGDAESARDKVKTRNEDYRANGRRAPIFVKEVANG